MRMELAMIEKIEMYIMGTMDDTQKTAFEKSLNANADLQMQTSFQTDLMEGIVRFGLKNASRQAYRKYNFKKWLIRLSILLLLLLTVSTVIIMSSNNTEQSIESSGNPVLNQETVILPETDSTGINDSTLADTSAFISADTLIQNSTLKSSQKKYQPNNTIITTNSTDDQKIINASNIENKTEQIQSENQTVTLTENIAPKENKLVCQWKIHQETNKEQLNKIVKEIENCDGKIETSAVNYKNGGVAKISFVVSNKSGKVEYHSPDLREGFIICINFYDEGISVGFCDERLNEIEQNDNNRDGISNSIKSNQQLTTDASDRTDNPGKNKQKRKRFFKQTEKFESGRKRGDYKTKKKYYR